LALLDEECLFPEGTDITLLQKLHKTFGANQYYGKPPDGKGKDQFMIKH
jgi:myosin heavy subunit